MIGAPFGLDELAFPANGNVDQALVWIVSRFVGNAIAAVNVTWLLMVVLSGLAATWCMRTIGASTRSAVVAGTLFALSPYALYRNIGHFGMAIYLVPFVCTVALQLVTGRLPERGYLKGRAPSCWQAVPFSRSTTCTTRSSDVSSSAWRQSSDSWRTEAGASCERGACASPCSSAVRCSISRPACIPGAETASRSSSSTRIRRRRNCMGLKIRTLISPVLVHSFPPFRWWAEKERHAQFPVESENTSARLGLVGALGFLGLLGLAGRSSRGRTPVGRADVARRQSADHRGGAAGNGRRIRQSVQSAHQPGDSRLQPDLSLHRISSRWRLSPSRWIP